MERIILGIDPGTNVMGYGIIGCSGNRYRLIDLGVLNLNKVSDSMEKLSRIYTETRRLIQAYSPAEAAIEEPFYGKNIQSMLKLGRAQGMAIAAAIHEQVPIYPYSPRKIKQSITGRGAASKEQVAAMLQRLLNMETLPEKLDATDGLAAAVCHFNQNNLSIIGSAGRKREDPRLRGDDDRRNGDDDRRNGDDNGRDGDDGKKGGSGKYNSWQAFISQNPGRVK